MHSKGITTYIKELNKLHHDASANSESWWNIEERQADEPIAQGIGGKYQNRVSRDK